jgi:hypothetical protein
MSDTIKLQKLLEWVRTKKLNLGPEITDLYDGHIDAYIGKGVLDEYSFKWDAFDEIEKEIERTMKDD